jgi:hypothetical protein
VTGVSVNQWIRGFPLSPFESHCSDVIIGRDRLCAFLTTRFAIFTLSLRGRSGSHQCRRLDASQALAGHRRPARGWNRCHTTLNVQHIESLNDVVAQVTAIPVKETLPDQVFEKADEVELVDIAPRDLMERMREGRVYPPDQAMRALENVFKEGNLIALRELALRKTAERVERDTARPKTSGPNPERVTAFSTSRSRAGFRVGERGA